MKKIVIHHTQAYNLFRASLANIQCYAASMAITYTIDLKQNIVFTHVDGVVDGMQMREHQDRLAHDSDFKSSMHELMDCSKATGVKMRTINKSKLAKSSPWKSDAKRAIIVPNLLIFGLARIFQTVMDGTRGEISIFYNSDSAVTWLGIKNINK